MRSLLLVLFLLLVALMGVMAEVQKARDLRACAETCGARMPRLMTIGTEIRCYCETPGGTR